MSLLARILFLSSSLSSAASVIYKGTGDEVVIPSGSDPGRITAVTWKHNEDIALEWYGGELIAYRHFNGHTTLDIFTGALTISDLTRDHSGFYTAEINNKVIGTTEVRVISPVPKPTVSQWCDTKMTYCTLTCEGNTTDSEPVTYSWEIFDVLNYYEGQQINLTEKHHDPWYRCEMKNPISSKTSEEFPNPFSSKNRTFIVTLVLFILCLLLIGLIVGIVIRRKCKSSQGSYSRVKFFGSKTPASNDQTGEEDKGTDKENVEVVVVSCDGVETSAQTPPTSSVVPDTNTQTEMLNTCEASIPDKTSNQPNGEPENSPKEEETRVLIHSPEPPESNHQTENPPKEEETRVQIHNSEPPESNNQTATATSEGQEALTSVAETSNESENSLDQIQTSGEIPGSSAPTENSQKEEEVQVQVHNSELPESNNQTENSPKKKEEIEFQVHKSEPPESNNQTENSQNEEEGQVHNSEPPENNNQTEKSAEDSNGGETDRALLEERNQIISVSA